MFSKTLQKFRFSPNGYNTYYRLMYIVPHQGPSEHPGFGVKSVNKTSYGMKKLVRPRNSQELLPPS